VLFDTILAAFISALTSGFAMLHLLSLPLLGTVATLAWLRGSWETIRNWQHLGHIFAYAVGMLLSVVVYLLLITNLQPWATGLFAFAADLGAQVSGGAISGAGMLAPSRIFEAGATAVSPIQDFMKGMRGWAAVKNIPTILNYTLAYVVVIVAFMGIALNISLTIIEFYFSLLCATVLVPWAPLAGTAFLAEFSIAWTAGMIVRMFIQTAVVGISIPLFETLVLATTPGGDPLWWESLGLVGGAVFFFVLSWIIPNRAVAIAGRGMALGIGGDAVTAGFSSAARSLRGFAGGASTVIAGATSWIRRERGMA
jgi:type IV secretory pathway TrbL component